MQRTTSGVTLKDQLGLSHLKYVSFVRLIGTSMRTAVVFYDTRRPNIPLNKQRVLKSYNTFSARVYPHQKEILMSPLIPLEEYNGQTQDLVIMSFDIAGNYGDRKLRQVRESSEKKRLSEWMTLANLSSTDSASKFTHRTRKQRNKAVKPENRTAKPVECILDDDGSVTYTFETTATLPIYPEDNVFQRANPDRNFALETNPEKTYVITVKILEFMKWLKETRPNYLELEKITWKEIRDVLEVAYIQVYSTSPSYHWQGINYWLSQLDGSLYPTDIAPKFWNRSDLHGTEGAFLDKHLYGLLRQFKFWYNPMASMVQKRMKDKGLL